MSTRNLWVGVILIGALSGCKEKTTFDSLPSIIGNSSAMIKQNFDPAQIKRGAQVYQVNCVGCHGPNGAGTPDWRKPNADGKYPPPPLDGTAHAWHHPTEVLKRTILQGTPPELGSMPAWEGKLTNQQIDDVIVWIKSLWPAETYDLWYKNFESKQ